MRRVGIALLVGLASQVLGCASDVDDEASELVELPAVTAPVAPADLLGLYDPTGGYLKNPRIRDWGGSPLLNGAYQYGDARYPVDYVLQPVAGSAGQYTSQSNITVAYGPMRCSYPVEIQINATYDSAGQANLYVRDSTPNGLPALLPVGAPCPRLQNVWRVHQRPYVKRGPSQVFASLMDDLCGDISARIGIVEQGKRIAAGPIGEVPPNIYAATGTWQALSTPGRDQQLRATFRQVHRFVTEQASGPSAPDRARQFLAIWNRHQQACRFEYRTSNGAPVPFTLNDVQSRLFQLSFDPYHCTEMRWGAYPDDLAEFASCNTQSETHLKRFRDETSLRNILDRPPA
jgi:hypothetical protein